jgi:replicative DNA helicase
MKNLVDVASERMTLAGLFRYGAEIYYDLAELLSADLFTDEVNQAIYKCITYLIDQKNLNNIDQASLIGAASELNLIWLNNHNELQYISSIISTHILQENVLTWVQRLKKLQIARQLRIELHNVDKQLGEINGTESIEDIVGLAENSLLDFTQSLSCNINTNPELIGDRIDEYIEMVETQPVDLVGISSGYKNYDKAIGGGFRRKTVSLIGARMKIGKSQLANNIAVNVVNNKIPALYLDTEMNQLDHWPRMLANLTYRMGVKVLVDDIESGKYAKNPIHKQAIYKAKEWIKNHPYYYLNVSGKSFESIVSIMRKWIHRVVKFNEISTNPCLIIYDYMKLLNADKLTNNVAEFQQLGFLMTSMHNFSVKYDVPILTFTQLNRDGISKEDTGIIASSDRLLWLATNFAVFKNKSDEEIAQDGADAGNKKLAVLAQRHGAGLDDGDYINMHMMGKYGLIMEKTTKFALKNKDNIGLNVNDGTAEIHA